MVDDLSSREESSSIIDVISNNRLELLVLALLVHSTGLLTTASSTVTGCF